MSDNLISFFLVWLLQRV